MEQHNNPDPFNHTPSPIPSNSLSDFESSPSPTNSSDEPVSPPPPVSTAPFTPSSTQQSPTQSVPSFSPTATSNPKQPQVKISSIEASLFDKRESVYTQLQFQL